MTNMPKYPIVDNRNVVAWNSADRMILIRYSMPSTTALLIYGTLSRNINGINAIIPTFTGLMVYPSIKTIWIFRITNMAVAIFLSVI